jgi:hypothetical protein
MARADWKDAIQMPLGIVPAGTGNGLAASIETLTPYDALLTIIKGHVRPMDLIAVQQPGEKVRFSHLAVMFGLISDIDLESERFRFLGSLRITIAAFVRVFNLRKYQLRLSYLPYAFNEVCCCCFLLLFYFRINFFFFSFFFFFFFVPSLPFFLILCPLEQPINNSLPSPSRPTRRATSSSLTSLIRAKTGGLCLKIASSRRLARTCTLSRPSPARRLMREYVCVCARERESVCVCARER